MIRRQFLVFAGGASLSALSGCLSNPGVNGGLLEVLSAEVPPQAKVTDATDERISDIEPIQRGLQQAQQHGTADIDVTDNEYETVAQALSALSWYSRLEHDSDYISGIYIQHEDSAYVVVLTPYCTNSWLWDAHSERGDYGWGGCIDPRDQK
jgi:hypothetical protein